MLLQMLAAAAIFAPVQAENSGQAWKEGKIKTLVTFGDSYTDENRLGYFIQHNGSAPPVGWDQPVVSLLGFKPTTTSSPLPGASNRHRRSYLGTLCQHLFFSEALQLRCLGRCVL